MNVVEPPDRLLNMLGHVIGRVTVHARHPVVGFRGPRGKGAIGGEAREVAVVTSELKPATPRACNTASLQHRQARTMMLNRSATSSAIVRRRTSVGGTTLAQRLVGLFWPCADWPRPAPCDLQTMTSACMQIPETVVLNSARCVREQLLT
jgi:hypothetical protein